METIKIIDLLNKIAKGEEIPQEIRYKHKEYKWERNVDYKEKNGRNFLLSDECINETFLNDEVEIIEEEKDIEPLAKLGNYKVNTGDDFLDKVLTNINERINHLIDKQTEIIDVVNEMRKEK